MITSASPLLGSVQTLVACSPRLGRVDLFVGACDGEVWQKILGSQQPWRSHGRPWPHPDSHATSDWLSVTASLPGRIEIFARHSDAQQTWLNRWEDDVWSGWALQAALSPEVEAIEGHRFVVDRDGRLQHQAPGRPGWDDLGGDIVGGGNHVAAVATGDASVEVFALWAGGALMRRSFDGEWSQWELVELLSAPAGPYAALRPRDFVALTVRGEGLRERTSDDGTPEWVANGGPGRLIVDFPPQHIAETILTTTTSSAARLAGPSSLHFVVADEPIALSVEGVLRAMAALPLAVAPREQGRASALELPWRLLLALQSGARCVHRTAPASSADGATEIWRTHVMGPGNSYAGVHPFAALPLELPFADSTPLRDKVGQIAALGAGLPGQAVSVDRLILSSYGAWFSGSASWPQLDWTHKTAMARDYYVRVLQRGVLFPFGHRAAVVETTERRFEPGSPSVAGLRKSWSLIVTEPSREYDVSAPHERAFPFQRVEIEPRLLTPVDEPDGSEAFWPSRDGQPVVFSIRAAVGNEIIEMQSPLLFSDGAHPERLDSIFALGPRGGEGLAQRPTALVGRSMPLAMKNRHEALEGATQQVRSLTFGGAPIASGPGFHPRIVQLEVELPAVNQLLGPIGALPATLSNDLLQSTPENPPDLLLDFPARRLNFGSAKAGVVAAPNMAVNQISCKFGPTVANLPINPAEIFGPDAKLLGVVSLSDVIRQVTGRPTIKWTGGPNPAAIMEWNEKLTARPGLAFIPGSDGAVNLEVKSGLSADGRPTATTRGVVADFKLNIPPGDKPLVILDFKELKFHAESGGLPTASFVMRSASLGSNLKFIQTLSEYLPQVGASGPKIDVTAAEIRANYTIAIPTPIALGVFTLQNLLLRAGVTLSLINQPITIDFAFGTRDNPFLVTVTGFGGGGYLELGIGAGGDDGGLQRFVGGIEFGASVAMNFGVASGEVHVFGGVVFAKKQASIEITGYLRIGGMVRVLGLISVSIELTVSLTYAPEPDNELRGAAKLVIAVDLTFWSTSVEIRCEKSFKGSELTLAGATSAPAAAPGTSVEAALGPIGSSFPWRSYCQAFVGE